MKKFWQKIKALFTKSDVEKTSLQKTAKVSILLGCVLLVGVIVYFAVIAPLIEAEEHPIPDLYEGEVYQNNSIYILRQYDRSEIKSVEIKNKNEHYKLTSYEENGSILFNIEGSEHITLSYESVASLLGDVRVLVTNSPAGQDRVLETATEEDLRHYGLDEASDPSWFEVTLNDGTSYRIYIGNALTTSSGYYVRLEGRKNVVTNEDGSKTEYDIVYALQSGLGNTVLADSAFLVSTELAPPYGNDIYNTSNFSIMRYGSDGTRRVIVQVGLAEEEGISAASQIYEMLYPKSYIINESAYSDTVLTELYNVQAESIVAYGESIYSPEVYEKYGLDIDKDRLEKMEDNNYALLLFNCADPEAENYDELASLLYFSKKFTDLDGKDYYYVYAPAYEVIGKVSAETFAFIEWDVANYTNPYMYYEYFTSVEYMELISERDGIDLRFTLSGKERKRHVDVTESGDNGAIVYRITDEGAKIPLVYDVSYKTVGSSIQFEGEFEIFRDLYYVLITRKLALYADIDEEMTSVDSAPSRIVRVKTLPKDHSISYYQYNSNGIKGEQLHDQGGNILCHNVVVTTTLSDGTTRDVTYDKAYYDEDANRFFLKSVDSNDGVEKPSGFEGDEDGLVKVTVFLPDTARGEYEETIYEYEIYDLYDEYTDIDGNVVKQLNPTYMYIIPTITTNTYQLYAGGEKVLLESTSETAEEGVYIRTATIDKLFSDTNKLLTGEEIDTMGVN